LISRGFNILYLIYKGKGVHMKNKIQQERVYMSMRRNYPLQWRY
jgi:hypothetical protein